MADEKDPRPGPEQPHDIKPVSILDEMKRSYLDYAMSVIVSRALPDVRDGLKPVHRRILYSMHENNFTPDRPYNKSSRTVGDTMGKFHPHGDLAIYDALVRMAQDFSMRAPLIDGQGNFGSVDGDPPAASRYTEARLEKIAMSMLEDLDKDTVDFRPNYDEKELEPAVLPARFPNLLVNGAGGIAVGMATNIPPHNLAETIDGALALMDKPDMSVEELMEYIPGPDFPTGGAILGRAGIRAAYATGRGSIIMRCQDRDRDAAQGSRGDHRHRDPLSGQQGDADRKNRRAGAREEDRRHLRPARRIRSRRHAHRHRAEARSGRRRRAQPALALHPDAGELRRQHDRAQRRQAGDADAARHADRLPRFSRGGRHPAHQTSC